MLKSSFNTSVEKKIKLNTIIEQLKKENEELKNGKWSKVRRKNIKLILLQDFIVNFQKEHNLNWNECSMLYSLLSANIVSSELTKIVNMDNGKIHSIEGLSVEGNKIIFNNNFFHGGDYVPADEEELINEEKVEESFSSQWQTYLKKYFKNIRMELS
jgi:hypothetical protein